MTLARHARRALAVLALACMPFTSLAQQPATTAAAERIPFKQDEGELTALMWRSVLAMAGLVVVALGAIYVMRRYGLAPPGRGPEGSAVRLVQSLRLGPRASLFVVQFGGNRVLIGQSERGLSRIASEPAPAPPPDSP